ncbi:MAG: hypothetical protein NVSMB46_05840 [Candidatus Saccharimonadales bacterium]
MNDIQVRKEADGWRSYIHYGKKIVVLDGYFIDEKTALTEAKAVNKYMFGN